MGLPSSPARSPLATAAPRARRGGSARRDQMLLAALAVLAERGYRGATMHEVAARARASKETLYSWFGDKRGLFEELVGWQAERVDAAVTPTLGGDGDGDGDGDGVDSEPRVVLRAFAIELLRLLLGERAVVINRAAISEAPTDPTFARILAERGRGSVVPNLVRYLERRRADGRLAFDDAEAAIDVLLGLIVGDQQVRRLLGVLPLPAEDAIEARADRAVGYFLALFGPDSAPVPGSRVAPSSPAPPA